MHSGRTAAVGAALGFRGQLEPQAAEDICGDRPSEDLTDLLTSLVDKSILIRTETNGVVRFRLLDTLRDYGRAKIQEIGAHLELRRRHLDWYRRLTRDAAAEWFSSRQIDWIERIDRELPNLREAIEFSPTDTPETASRMASDLGLFCAAHGLLGEGRRWLDWALAATPPDATTERVETLYYASVLASSQRDLPAAATRAQDAQELAAQLEDPAAQARVAIADGFDSLLSGQPERACERLEAAVDRCADLTTRAMALALLGRAHELRGDADAALTWNRRVLELSEAHGESVFRSWALWSVGIESWRNGDRHGAADALKQGLQLTHRLRDARTAASYLEVLAWIAAEDGKSVVAAVMTAAAGTMGGAVGNYAFLFPNLPAFHEECDDRVRNSIDTQAYEAARQKGRSLRFDDAVAYALREA